MAKITYIQPDGTEQTIDAVNGTTVMETAVDNSIEGIIAECGGSCSCATCHVYVNEQWVASLPEPDAMEDGMLDCVLDRRPNSRLSCQIQVSDAIDGLIVRVPDEQV